MRKGETSRVMIKPKFGYDGEDNRDVVFFPRGWDTEERKATLRSRRVFFDVTLHDWIVRHDILGNGLLVKTLLQKGRGFDRPSTFDTVNIDYKLYQGETIFEDKQDVTCQLLDN